MHNYARFSQIRTQLCMTCHLLFELNKTIIHHDITIRDFRKVISKTRMKFNS